LDGTRSSIFFVGALKSDAATAEGFVCPGYDCIAAAKGDFYVGLVLGLTAWVFVNHSVAYDSRDAFEDKPAYR